MILTEADLHAYNAGELSPEAVRVLEDDPLAVQDAARLRALSSAIRDEAPMVVAGRAETIERLRKSERPRVGVPGFVWVAGVAGVIGLVAMTIPRNRPADYVIRPALDDSNATANHSLDTSAVQKGARNGVATGGAGMNAAEASSDRAAPAAPQSAVARAAQSSSPEVRAKTRTEALRIVNEAIARVGGTYVDDAEAKLDPASRTIRVRVADERYETFVQALLKSDLSRELAPNAPAESPTAESSPGRLRQARPTRVVEIRWIPAP